jgi:hypothetical protein
MKSRYFDHIDLHVRDVERTKRFCMSLLNAHPGSPSV